MDLIKEKRKKWQPKQWISGGVVLAILAATAIIVSKTTSRASAEVNELVVSEVKQGNLQLRLDGYGQLKTFRQKVLSTQREAMVEEIIHKPGAQVKPDTILVKMANPTLQQELLKAEQEHGQAVSQLRALKLGQEKTLLVEQGTLEKLKASYESASLKLTALNELKALGTVSKLDLRQAEITAKEIETQVRIHQNTINKMMEMNQEHLKVEESKIEHFRISYESAKSLVDTLEVRAGMEGVLQELNVELGQSLIPGQKIGIVGKVDELIALLKIPQAQAELVEIGQQAEIDTHRDKIGGIVSRIDPIVADGTVTIEIKLLGTLPSSARPERNIDGTILTEKLDSVRYIPKPNNVRPMSDAWIYKVSEDGHTGVLTQVTYGVESGNYIEIKAGLQPGDKIIAADPAQFGNEPILLINN